VIPNLIKFAIVFLAGALFSVGIWVVGMLRPQKVIAFLDVTSGAWDPSMPIAMFGAILVSAVAWQFAKEPRRPPYGTKYPGPPPPKIDLRLVGGAAVFGIGWGLSGFCPGNAFPNVVTGVPEVEIFTAAMVVGMVIARFGAGADAPAPVSPPPSTTTGFGPV
jgi:hypothetical protein